MQKSYNPFYWKTIEAKEIKPGNLITAITAKTPRLVSNVELSDGNRVVTITEMFNDKEHLYIKTIASHKFDVLMNSDTKLPATQGEVYVL